MRHVSPWAHLESGPLVSPWFHSTDLHPARLLLLALLGLILVVLDSSGCTVNPVSGQPEVTLVTEEQEKKIGDEEAKKVQEEMGLMEDGALTGYLDRLGQRLAAESPRQNVPYDFHLVDMIEPNAFALPGGHVYVTRGLLALANSEDELAGVIGHEIGHVAARHTVQRISRQGPFAVITGVAAGLTGLVSPLAGNIIGGIGGFAQSLVFAPYSRSQETEADTIGQEMAAKAGWDPAAFPTFLENLGREVALLQDGPRRPSFFDSHPATPDRVARTTKHAKELQRAEREPISPTHEAFLAQLDGLVVGQRAANGIIRERSFQHPDHNFFVQFPEKWQIQNTPKRVVAVAPDGGAAVVLGTVAEGTDPLDGARAIEAASKTSVVAHAKPTTIGNLPAARALLEGDSKVMIDLTWIAHAGLIYQIAGLAPRTGFAAIRPAFDSVAQSFRPLSPEERDAIREKRIRLVKAHAGEQLESLIARSNSSWKEKHTAIANGLVGTEPLNEGQIIKVVVAEPYVPKKR